MDEERLEMPLTPDIIESRDDCSRRSSIRRTIASNSGEKIIPHYLRPSPGSCHDICKYGGRHGFLAKENRPVLKGKILTPSESPHPIMNTTLPARLQARKKKLSVTSMSSPYPGTPTEDVPKMIRQDRKVTKQNVVSPGKNVANVVKSCVALMPKRVAGNSPSSSLNPTRDQSLRKGANEKAGTSKISHKRDLVLQKAALHPKASVNDITSFKKEKHPGVKSVSPRKIEHMAKRDEAKPHIEEKVSEKTLYVVEPKPERKILGSKGASLLKSDKKAEKDEIKMLVDENISEKTLYMVEPKPENRSLKLDTTENGDFTTSSSLSTFSSTPSLPLYEKEEYIESEYVGTETGCRENKPENDSKENKPETDSREKENETDSREKEPETSFRENEDESDSMENETGTSSRENEADTDSRENETETISMGNEGETSSRENEIETDSGHNEYGNSDQVRTAEEYRRRSRRAATGDVEDNETAHKLKFRRGKVVNPQSENNAPRRLRFRRGRVLGEDQNGKVDVSRQHFKKAEVIHGPLTSEAETQKVILKHQDVNAKKDGQGCLLNNVIEETASKLVEIRMSKVKALVGAFETVISLQEK